MHVHAHALDLEFEAADPATTRRHVDFRTGNPRQRRRNRANRLRLQEHAGNLRYDLDGLADPALRRDRNQFGINLCLGAGPATAPDGRRPASVADHPLLLQLVQQARVETLVRGTLKAVERGCLAGPHGPGSPGRRSSGGAPDCGDGNLVGSDEQDHQRPAHVPCGGEPYQKPLVHGYNGPQIRRCCAVPCCPS